MSCVTPIELVTDKNFRPKGFHGGSTTDSFQTAPVRVDAASPSSPAPTQAAVNAVASPAAASTTGGKYCTKCGEIKKAGANFCGIHIQTRTWMQRREKRRS